MAHTTSPTEHGGGQYMTTFTDVSLSDARTEVLHYPGEGFVLGIRVIDGQHRAFSIMGAEDARALARLILASFPA